MLWTISNNAPHHTEISLFFLLHSSSPPLNRIFSILPYQALDICLWKVGEWSRRKAGIKPKTQESLPKTVWWGAQWDRERTLKRVVWGCWPFIITHIEILTWFALISVQNMYLSCWGKTVCHRCGTSEVEIIAEHTAKGSALAYWHLGWCLILGWLLNEKLFQVLSFWSSLLLYY